MSKFKVGDRVRVYSAWDVKAGTVDIVGSPTAGADCLFVSFDTPFFVNGNTEAWTEWAHTKQCRRLLPVERYVIKLEDDGSYWLAPGQGTTSQLKDAHRYTYAKAVELTNGVTRVSLINVSKKAAK